MLVMEDMLRQLRGHYTEQLNQPEEELKAQEGVEPRQTEETVQEGPEPQREESQEQLKQAAEVQEQGVQPKELEEMKAKQGKVKV